VAATGLRKTREETLRKMIEMDEGMSSLAKWRCPHSSPISQSGMLFFNTLLDENAACHLALGSGFHFCCKWENISEEEYAERGGNSSLGHTDLAIGSAEMGYRWLAPGGGREPVMRQGEWSFQLGILNDRLKTNTAICKIFLARNLPRIGFV
jgi:aminopeptidase